MENRVTSTSKLDQAEQGISPLPFTSVYRPVFPLISPLTKAQPSTIEVSITPIRSTVSPPAIFRPPGMEGSDPEEEEEEDVKHDMSDIINTTTNLTTSYPSMLRLLHPHLYRHYHPYLHYLGYQGQTHY